MLRQNALHKPEGADIDMLRNQLILHLKKYKIQRKRDVIKHMRSIGTSLLVNRECMTHAWFSFGLSWNWINTECGNTYVVLLLHSFVEVQGLILISPKLHLIP